MVFESSGDAKLVPPTAVVSTALNGPHAEDFNKAHLHTDVDRDHAAIHHTLGFSPNQGIPGAILDNIAPIGELKAYAGPSTEVPAGFMLADGRSLAIKDYPALFKKIGYEYGGAGTNFNIPDSRNRPLVGTNGDAELGNSEGLSVGSRNMTVPAHNHLLNTTHTTDFEPIHTHGGTAFTTTDGSHGHSFGAVSGSASSTIERATGAGTAAHPSHTHNITGNTAMDGMHSHGVTLSQSGAGGHDHQVVLSGTTANNTGATSLPFIKVTAMIRYSWGL